jgi:type I restriction enzyme M protein
MAGEEAAIVNKLWNYCDVLRDDGVSYGDYVEQLTYLLFLKMVDEETEILGKPSRIPEDYNWDKLRIKTGEELDKQYKKTLEKLGDEPGLLGQIYTKSQNKIRDPAKLRRLIAMIDEETWQGLDIDVKGAIYEGLLQKNAEDVKTGAGQYFTPRPLIKAMVECIKPKPGETIMDPACGTGGFFIAAHDYLSENYNMDREEKEYLKYDTFRGWEIVQDTARLCLMNMYLHGIEAKKDQVPITVDDSLAKPPNTHYDIVLTNPPFGKRSSITVFKGSEARKETLTYSRPDFWTTTSNKQLNFLQHVRSLLRTHGRAAIVIPDNVLFEGGAGETVRRQILKECDCHTLLRLPTGVFYAQGVKANVLFFDRKPGAEQPWTKELWIYDLRTNKHFTLIRDSLTLEHLKDFIECYKPENRHQRTETERFKRYTYDELVPRDKANLDIIWIKDESLEETENLPEPEIIAAEIVENLRSALDEFIAITEELED